MCTNMNITKARKNVEYEVQRERWLKYDDTKVENGDIIYVYACRFISKRKYSYY